MTPDRAEWLNPGEYLRPLHDNLIVQPLDWDASQVLVAIRRGRPVRGKVIAAGPGAYRKRYNADRSKMWDTNVFVPTEVKPGDVIELGGLNVFDGQGYAFPEVWVDGAKRFVCCEKDVAIVREAA